MDLYGTSIIGNEPTTGRSGTFRGLNPQNGRELEPSFYEAADQDINQAFTLAEGAIEELLQKSPDQIAQFLDSIAEHIVGLGDELIQRASDETGLPSQRLNSERGRTVGQLRMFAGIVREGSWVEATIDTAQPDRQPLPRPDLRRMLVPIGPVVVFGASNFPLAFSVAGGDTASALAAGNPVIVKAHPAHPGTSELVARAIVLAARQSGMPMGVFSLLQGGSHELGLELVRHPAAKAVGFTGSLQAGRALFDAAAQRGEPIPVYAEMGSVNPVFVLPGAMRERAEAIAQGLQQSVTLGVGQFCTCPGLVAGIESEFMAGFSSRLTDLMTESPVATMLHPGIRRSYQAATDRLERIEGVLTTRATAVASETRNEAQPIVFHANAPTFFQNSELGEEAFGPSTLLVECANRNELLELARGLHGHLTATIHGTLDDLTEFADLVDVLKRKVGRLVFNGFPTGVEVSSAMHHGGPYPATTDSRSTSVGSAAIKRFARPVCFQNFPQEALPIELRNENKRRIWRTVDNELTRDALN